jgi:hypothetical protein
MASGWYVANTAPSEWIRYKKVYLAAGTYRFTARTASPVGGSTIHFEVDNVPVRTGVVVPNTGRADTFAYVHMGTQTVSQGYHDLKIVFDSADVSLDWFMLSKDSDASTTVKASDITLLRPDGSGTLIAPIVGFSYETETTGLPSALCSIPTKDVNGMPYSDSQLTSWYSVPMYEDRERRGDRYWDILVEELLASRADVPFFHCRATTDFTHDLQDRNYAKAAGAFEGRWLIKLSEAVARNPQAVSAFKIGMFWENGGIADQFQKLNGYFPAWGDPALVDHVMTYWLGPWFDNVPPSMLYQPIAGRPIINIYTGNPEKMVNDGKMGEFLSAVRCRLQQQYGYNPLFIVPPGGGVNGPALTGAWGQAPWVAWNGPLLTSMLFSGSQTFWGTTQCGSRRRLDTVWLNDWNPTTDTGTPIGDGDDAYQSRLDASGNSVLLNSLDTAQQMGLKLVSQEGFTNLAEGNALFRSYHKEYRFPNQHIAAMRQYADPVCQTLMFEAEGCDDYLKVANDGNSGGTYRKEWYSGGNHLDVYRPLHNLQNWISRSSGPGNLTRISTGYFDVWAVATDGKVWAQTKTGAVNSWHQVQNGIPVLSSVSVSKTHVWGLNGTTVYYAKLPYGSDPWWATNWTQTTGSMIQISAATTKVWGVDASGNVYWRPIDGSGSGWTQVGGTIDKVFAGDSFVWGIRGSDIYLCRTDSGSWTQVPNPNGINQLAVGCDEVWGINATGQVFRRSASGIGDWDTVAGPGGTLTSISVGEGYAWGLVGSTPYAIRLEGFTNSPVTSPMQPRAVAGVGNVSLTWTAVTSATGYHIKRATTSGGPYSTIASNILPLTLSLNYSDTSVSNGTTYYYVVSAVTPSGETANSAEASATPQSTAPSAPDGLVTSLGLGNQATLVWSDRSNNESGFRIERKTDSGAFVPLAILPKAATSFTDTTILAGSDYSYRVCAFNAAASSNYTNESAFSTTDNYLSRTGWTAAASTSAGGSPANALDASLSTRWGTGGPQAPGQWFQLDMGTLNHVYQVDLDQNGGGDYPRCYQVTLSTDGTNWTDPAASGTGTSSTTSITFPLQKARYIRIAQTDSTTGAWWSINDISAYGYPAQDLSRTGWTYSASISGNGQPPSKAGDGNLSTRWSTGGVQASGQWFTVDMGSANTISQITLAQGSSTNDYPRGYEVRVSNDGANWGGSIATGVGTAGAATTITLVPRTARYLRIVQTGNTSGNYWSIHELTMTGAPAQALNRAGWIASASAGANPSAALDGSTSTRWGTGGAQAPGQWFQVDMQSARTFSQVVMDAASSSNDFPRGYEVAVSNDGTNWTVVAIGTGSSAITTVRFPTQSARYIRVTQTANTSGTWWSIHEFNAY